MNLSFFIAKRYFFSRKKKSFINIISILSMVGVCVGTMALVIILSVFNGLEELNRIIFKAQNAAIRIQPIEGKTFERNEQILSQLQKIENVAYLSPVIEENALARNGTAQMVVSLKGVDAHFEQDSPLKNALVEGDFFIKRDSVSYAFVGSGVYNLLSLSVQDFLFPLEIWFPRNEKLNMLNPEENINTVVMPVSGVFSLEQQYDNLIYLPIQIVEQLTDNQGRATAIEVALTDENQLAAVKEKIKGIMGDAFSVKDRDEQNEALFRAIKIEKLFIFISLLLIIGIASFNIFFSLTMLVIDKKDDIETLSALGANTKLVRRIFFNEGIIISFIGAATGLILGALVCAIQQQFGIVSMGMSNAIVDAYPVKMKWDDFLYSAIGIVFITILASFFPAKRAVAYMEKK